MLLDGSKALTAFQKVKLVREEYRRYSLAPNMNVVSVSDLIATVSHMYGLSIEVYDVPFEGDYTRGMLLRYQNRAEIYVRRQIDSDWKRFTVVKELSHLILDEPEDWSIDGVQTIGDLQNDFHVNGELAKPTSHSETFAEFAALEIMYPFDCRAGDLAKIANGSESNIKIAAYHGMPTAMVERALSNSYRAIAERLWASVD